MNNLNQQLVQQLYDQKRFTDPRIGEAFLAVPRHYFLPHLSPQQAYADRAIATKQDAHGRVISSSSQPSMMAIMLQQLDLQPGHNVLEIGAGTGYNAALMQQLVAPHGRVTTIDFDRDLVETARENLARAGIEGVTVLEGDGSLGDPSRAPYDRIILTVGAGDIAPAWWAQLKAGGLLLLPLGLGHGPQKSIAFRKQNSYLESVSLRDCGFLRLRGEMAPSEEATLTLPTAVSGVSLALPPDTSPPNPNHLAKWFDTPPPRPIPTGLTLSRREVWTSLSFWLAIQAEGLCTLHTSGAWAAANGLPMLFAHQRGEERSGESYGLLTEAGLAVLTPLQTLAPTATTAVWPLGITQFGPDHTPAERLHQLLHSWDQAGRPPTEAWHIRAYPHEQIPPSDTPHTIWTHRPHFSYALRYA